jgi:hypothetical protein
MKLQTAPEARRSPSPGESLNYPPRQRAAAAVTRNDLVRRLEQANAQPAPPASPPDAITADSVRGLTPMQALDRANGSTLDPLRHRAGSTSQ